MVRGWHDWVGTFTGVALITVAALPVAALAVWVLARGRRVAGTAPAWRRSLAEVGMVYGTLPWVWMTMLPGAPSLGQGGSAARSVRLVPLRDLFEILASGPGPATRQIVGNLLVFAALGFFAPQRFPALASVPRILALAAGCSILVEAAQYVWLDRVSSVDDVLLNAAGAALAALVSRRRWREPVAAVGRRRAARS